MTAGCEAIALPAIFLTIVLLGGVRVSDITVLVAPSVFTLVLGVLLVRVLVQCGALAPDRLVGSARSALANVNGLVVLVTLWAASVQTLALLVPESGLPRLAFNVFFLIMLLNTAAASPDPASPPPTRPSPPSHRQEPHGASSASGGLTRHQPRRGEIA